MAIRDNLKGGSSKKLYEALQYSGLVTEDMTFAEMCEVLAEEYPNATPWIAYIGIDGKMTANLPASAPPQYSGTDFSEAEVGAHIWRLHSTNTSHYISSKNVDGTQYIPTQGCNYVDVIVRTDINHKNILTITGVKSTGSEETILNYSIPKYNDNTNNILDGVTFGNNYPHVVTNIDVSGYKKVKILTKSGAANGDSYIGYGFTRFHN